MDFDHNAYFSAVDYAIFAGVLTISALIGVYFAFFAKKKQNTTKEYLMGSKSVGVFPISMSLIASNISGISLMGLPSEVYTFGTQLSVGVFADIAAQLFGAYTILPVLYNLDITSSYEYLERRFNSTLRKLGSLLFIVSNILYVPIVIYVPALAFAQISGISLSILIPLVCTVCTFYTALGGLKAVVWTDTFQTLMMIIGVVAIAFIGTNNAGGVSEVWRRGEESGRIEFFETSWDMTLRQTFFSVMLKSFFGTLSFCAVNQATVQRELAMSSLTKARSTVFILAIGLAFLTSFSFYTGLVIYATFHDCDPITLQHVKKADGIVPYFVMKFSRDIPAIPGIFIAGIFSAGLSTLSTCLNAMCCVTYEDFIKPHVKVAWSEVKAATVMKIMTVVFGIVTMILATYVDKLGGVIQTSSSLGSITLGTLLGIYLLGMFCPWANSAGAFIGTLVGSVFVGWISIGAQLAIGNKEISYPWKPFSTAGCDNTTLTSYLQRHMTTTTTTPSPAILIDQPFFLYRISYMYYTPLGVIICLIVGVIASWLTGFQDPDDLDPKLLCSVIRKPFEKRYNLKHKKQNKDIEISIIGVN